MFVSEVKDNIFIVSHKKQNKGREKCPLINTKRAKTIIKMKSCRTRQQKIEYNRAKQTVLQDANLKSDFLVTCN